MRRLSLRSVAAFTIVELLIVVGILVIMLTLLWPTIRTAKYVSQQAACMSNLRDVGRGLNTYAIDNNGFYPKNGIIRNTPVRLKGDHFDVKTLILPYFEDVHTTFRCPLIPLSFNIHQDMSSYGMFFDTRASKGTGNPIANNYKQSDGSPLDRLAQRDPNGKIVADQDSWSAAQTWYWVYVDESKLLRRMHGTWTYTPNNASEQAEFNVLAMDMIGGRGHPTRSRFSNHPSPHENWRFYSRFGEWKCWAGDSGRFPATTANYLTTGGDVHRYSFKGGVYYYEDNWTIPMTSVNEFLRIPDDFRLTNR